MGEIDLNQTMFLPEARPPAVAPGENITTVFHNVTLVQFDVQYRHDLLLFW